MHSHHTAGGVIAEQIRRHRERLGMNRHELATECARLGRSDITYAVIVSIETGRSSAEGKKRREAAEAFADAGREDSAAKERAEAGVIADYLPAQLEPAEIATLVADAIAKSGVEAGEGMRAMGKVMGIVQPQVKGRADGGAVAAEVRRQLDT